MKLYFIENRYPERIARLGDYGFILWTGFADRDDAGEIFIERAGPFTPDAYLTVSHLICTDNMRAGLANAGVNGVDFLPTIKKKVTNVDWQHFPDRAEIYDVLPDINEPEDLIDELPNDEQLLASMPEYWAIQPTSRIKIRQIVPYKYKTRHSAIEAYDVASDLGDIVLADTHRGYFATERGREIFEQIGGNFFTFVPLKVAD